MIKDIPVCKEHTIHEDVVKQLKENMLCASEYNALSTLFKMFSDPSRLKILSMLFQNELCVCDIVCLLEMSQSAVSHQLSILRSHRLIKYRRDGKNIFYSMDDEHIQMIYNAGLEHILE